MCYTSILEENTLTLLSVLRIHLLKTYCKKMKAKKILLAFSVFLGITLLLPSCGYNSMVQKEEAIEGAWAQVENQYQRRADLIPNLVKTVESAAIREQDILEGVVNARSKATQVTIDPKNLSQEELDKFDAAQGELSQALGRLLMITENYPQLQSIQGYTSLMDELAGTENRIATERMRFNQTVQDYNTFIRKFPANIVAGIFGFKSKPYFKAKPGTEEAPELNFSNMD